MQFDVVLRTFTAFFEREGIRYALVGGLAIHAWGSLSRTTRDADLAIDAAARERAIAFAESIGFETLYASSGYSNHVEGEDRVDLMYLYGTTADEVFSRADRRPVIGDLVLPVARPEHLAAMKAAAMKNFPHRVLVDSPDVAFLLHVDGVDRDSIRDYFAKHGLLDLFDAIEKRSR